MFCRGSRRRKSSESVSLMRLGCGSARSIVRSLLSHERFDTCFTLSDVPQTLLTSKANTISYTDPGTCDCRYSASGVKPKSDHRSPWRRHCYTYPYWRRFRRGGGERVEDARSQASPDHRCPPRELMSRPRGNLSRERDTGAYRAGDVGDPEPHVFGYKRSAQAP